MDHQGLERNVWGQELREMEGSRTVRRRTHSKIHSKHIERVGKMKKVKFTYDEIQALMIVLTEFRNMLMEEDRSTDIIDDIMLKLM